MGDVDTTGLWSCREHAPAYTTFIALQDVSADMGPTEVFPRTHTPEIAEQVRKALKNNKVANQDYADYFEWPSHRILLRKGDAAIVDCHLFHRGGPNWATVPRLLVHFTVVSRACPAARGFWDHYRPVREEGFGLSQLPLELKS